MSNQRSDSSYRHEAEPLDWDRLSRGQLDVINRFIHLLHGVWSGLSRPLEDRPPKSDWRFPPLDLNRPSRLALFNGERGVGKTTALLSCIRLLQSPQEFRNLLKSDGRMTITGEQVEPLSRNVVVLDPLDMEPFPHSLNLIGSILVRVDERMKAWHGAALDEESGAHSRDLLSMGGGFKAVADFATLAQDISIAWEGNIERRQGALDPEDYVIELQRAVRARLHVNSSLKTYLDELAKRLARNTGVENPIFILPVDDADLAPRHTLDLLRMIRMISVPRLFFVILADMELLESTVYFDGISDLAEVAGSAAMRETAVSKTLLNTASALSHAKLRKLIPHAHRLNLRAHTVAEALRFPHSAQNVHQDSEGRNKSFSLRELMGEIRILDRLPPLRERVISLAEFFALESDDISAETSQGDEDAQSWYSPLRMLKATPRQNYDLWMKLEELKPDLEGADRESASPENREERRANQSLLTERVTSAISQHAVDLIKEDRFLNQETRSLLESALQRNPTTAEWEFQWTHINLALNLEAPLVRDVKGRSRRSKELDGNPLFPTSFQLRTSGEHRIVRVVGSESEIGRERDEQQDIMMLGRTRYAMLAAHDLIVSRKPPFGSESRWGWPFPIGNIDSLVKVDWSDGNNTCTLGWDPPIFYTIRSLDRFLELWTKSSSHWLKRGSRGASAFSSNLDLAAAIFIRCSIDTLTGSDPHVDEPLPSSDISESTFKKVNGFLELFGKDRISSSPQKAIGDAVLPRLILLALPESGLSLSFRVDLTMTLMTSPIDLSRYAETVRDIRAESYRRFCRDGLALSASHMFGKVGSSWAEISKLAQSLLTHLHSPKYRVSAKPKLDIKSKIDVALRELKPGASTGIDAASIRADVLKDLFSKYGWKRNHQMADDVASLLKMLRQAEEHQLSGTSASFKQLFVEPIFDLSAARLEDIERSEGVQRSDSHSRKA